MNSVFFFILLCIFVIEVCISSKNQQNKNLNIKCDEENRSKANICAEKLWFVGRRSRKYPENEPQMTKHCKQTSNLIKCVKDFTDECGKEVQKQLANVMLYTVKAIDKSYCSKSAKREEMIKMSSCGNTIRDASSNCMEHFMKSLGKANEVQTRYKVPQACCAFHEMKSCIMKSAQSVGNPICGDKSLDNLEKYINSMSGNTMNLMCSDYDEDSDKCQHLPPLPKGSKFTNPPSIIVGFGQLLEEN